MIQSMTGYGKVTIAYKEKKINVEIKSLNSKALDLSTRIAPLYREKEMEIRQMLAAALERGKVDFCIWIDKDATLDATPINGALMENYYRQIKDIAARTGIPEPQEWFGMLLRMPDVMAKTEQEVLDDEEWMAARGAIGNAIEQLQDFRRQEGAALQCKFTEKIDNIAALLSEIEPYEKMRVEKIRSRIVDGLNKIREVEYDKNRTGHQRRETTTGQQSEIFQRDNGRRSRTRQETRIHRPGNGTRDKHHWFEEQLGRNAEHRSEDERRTGADKGTGSQCTLSLEFRVMGAEV